MEALVASLIVVIATAVIGGYQVRKRWLRSELRENFKELEKNMSAWQDTIMRMRPDGPKPAWPTSPRRVANQIKQLIQDRVLTGALDDLTVLADNFIFSYDHMSRTELKSNKTELIERIHKVRLLLPARLR